MGIYYTFFGCYLFLIAGIFGSIEHRNWRLLASALFLIAITSLIVLGNMPHYLFLHWIKDINLGVGQRTPSEAELYGLKITQLLLPISGFYGDKVKELYHTYNTTAPLVTENISSSLGLIGSIGFLLLLCNILLRNRFVGAHQFIIFNFSRLNIACILLATIGGLGSFFAYTISSSIRSYNRISVFIAFFSLYAFFIFLQNLIDRRFTKNKNKLYFILTLLIVGFGLCDQVGMKHRYTPDYIGLKNTFISDEKFIQRIEKTLPPYSKIFQLPIVPFPEYGRMNKMEDYDHFRGYLHSHTLAWSYGAISGRETLAWQQSVSVFPTFLMIQFLKEAGFRGIYINREGFLDQGWGLQEELTNLLKQEPFVSEDKHLIFYYLL